MDEKFLIDTNIIIYYLKDEIPADHIERVEHILERCVTICNENLRATIRYYFPHFNSKIIPSFRIP